MPVSLKYKGKTYAILHGTDVVKFTDSYGRTVNKGQGVMEFTGLQLGAFNPATFNQVGHNIVFSNIALNAFFTLVTFNEGVISLSFVQAGVGGLTFQYFDEDILIPQYSMILNPKGGEVAELYHEVRLHIYQLPLAMAIQS